MKCHSSFKRIPYAATVILCILPFLTGCVYLKDRALDLTDVIDFKYTWSTGPAGIKVHVTDYVASGIGLGLNGEGSISEEWYGRYKTKLDGFLFCHLVVCGVDNTGIDNMDKHADMCYLGYHDRPSRPPMIDRFRVGAEAFVPVFHLGVFLNLGELADFLIGFTTVDIAEDDGIPKGTDLEDRAFHIRKKANLKKNAEKEKTATQKEDEWKSS